KLTQIKKPFENQISKLNDDITNVHNEYMKVYRKAEGEQSEKYGHVSTPAYEKKINKLEIMKQEKASVLEKKIADVKAQMESQADFIFLTKQIKSVENKIKNAQQSIVNSHKPSVDSLQELLNTENSNYKDLKKELNQPEQNELELKRDSIRANPCI
ncbi:MAG TPA: hypothetical protein VLB84_16670, partial [Bacteroidia bacterium]|nr:hypothetical protein [Bacteroidia bacterium]